MTGANGILYNDGVIDKTPSTDTEEGDNKGDTTQGGGTSQEGGGTNQGGDSSQGGGTTEGGGSDTDVDL